MAVAGPGRSVPEPMDFQVPLVKVYWATLVIVPSDNFIEPAAISNSWFACQMTSALIEMTSNISSGTDACIGDRGHLALNAVSKHIPLKG
jgi:hypothetical protein